MRKNSVPVKQIISPFLSSNVVSELDQLVLTHLDQDEVAPLTVVDSLIHHDCPKRVSRDAGSNLI